MHRYKSLMGFSIYALCVQYVLRTRYALRGVKGFIPYRIYRQINISIFPLGKNIELRSNISIKKQLPEEEKRKFFFGQFCLIQLQSVNLCDEFCFRYLKLCLATQFFVGRIFVLKTNPNLNTNVPSFESRGAKVFQGVHLGVRGCNSLYNALICIPIIYFVLLLRSKQL